MVFVKQKKVTGKKAKYIFWNKLWTLTEKQNKFFVIDADNVGSKQIQQVRVKLREVGGAMLFGKNSLIKAGLTYKHVKPKEEDPDQEDRMKIFKENPNLQKIMDLCKGNVGFVFVKKDLNEVKEIILSNRRPAEARSGTQAQCEVKIPQGPTGLDPSQTSFFQALKIGTKIEKGQIAIMAETVILEKNQLVSQSEVVLLKKLNIKPFSFGLEIKQIFDNGNVQDAKILEISNEDVINKFKLSCRNIAAIGLELGLPNEVSVVHSVIGAFKNIVSLSHEAGHEFEEGKMLLAFLKDPNAFNVCSGNTKSEEKKVEVVEEEEEEDVNLGGGGLFGDDDDDW